MDLLVSPLELGRARRCAENKRGVHVHTAESLRIAAAEKFRALAAVRALMKKRRIRRVRVSPRFPLHAARYLEAEGIAIEAESGTLLPGRVIKTEPEIRFIHQSLQATVEAMREAIAMIRAARVGRKGVLRHGSGPLTSEAVRARISHVLLDKGLRDEGTIVAGGKQAADPHERGHGPLYAREAIVMDIFPRHEGTGYWGDLTRTVAKGKVCEVLLNMYAAVEAAQAAALENIRPGKAFRTVHRAAHAEMERRGFHTTLKAATPEGFIHGTGHGLGLELHEAPSLMDVPGRLKKGHVVTVEPGLYYRDVGGIRIEDTVAVTATGAHILAPLPRVFRLDS